MKKNLLAICFLVGTTSHLAAQTEAVYPFHHTSLIQLIDDSVWIKKAATEYVRNNPHPDNKWLLFALMAQEDWAKADSVTDVVLSDKRANSYRQVLASIIKQYLKCKKAGNMQLYLPGITSWYEKHPMDLTQMEMMNDQRLPTGKEKIFSVFSLATSDSAALSETMKFDENFFKSPEKSIQNNKMGLLIYYAAMRRMALALVPYQTQYVATLSNKLSNKLDFYAASWKRMLYVPSKAEKLYPVLAANIQTFDKDEFPQKHIWVNKNEITDNGVDDDSNGVVDDIHGIIFNPFNNNLPEANKLTRKENLTFFLYENKLSSVAMHGTMSVELMIKNNPTVKILAAEHVQYDSLWTFVRQKFTHDTLHNQYLIDSLIQLRLGIWRKIAKYINQNNVRVAQVNSIGFLRDGNEFVLTGATANDTASLRKYTWKKFYELVAGYKEVFNLAPNTIWIIAAGNNYSNTQINPYLSNQIHTSNTLTVGALRKDFFKTDYSDYGADVDVYAPAHFDLKSKLTYPESSGTSAASPVVCNTVIQLLSLNPKLTAAQLKQLIIQSSDKDLYEKGINLLNPKKAVEMMKKMKK